MDHHCHLPKFKSIPPPSLPLSSPLISPSSYLAFSELLDSPVLFSNSNLVASPTTGAFSGEEFNKWSNYGHGISEVSDFTFQLPRAVSQSSSPHEPWKRQQEDKNKKTKVKSEFDHSSCQLFHASQIIQETKNKSSSDDGYKWRKYGQKQAKGSENPRSYYKCTYPSCPTKKKVETSPEDGHVTEIVYKGEHNHPKPTTNNYKPYNNNSSNAPQHNNATSQLSNSDLSATSTRRIDSETSVSTGEGGGCGDDLEGMSSRWNGSETQTLYPKKRKGGYGDDNRRPSPTISENRTVRKPRVVVQTLSEMDILDDGYKWRKYGQKVVKGNPNPRSYYKCTSTGCPVRKHVERAAQDTRAVITTYEGRHNHDLPVARGGGGGGAPIKPPPIRPTAIPRTMTTSADHQGVFEYRPEEKFQQTNSSFVLSGFQENRDSIMSRTKDEPTDNSVFASFLSY